MTQQLVRSFCVSFVCLNLLACAKPQYLNVDAPTFQKSGSPDGCVARFTISGLCVDLKWEKHPTEDDFGSFIFTTSDTESGVLKDLSNDPASPLKIVLWMPSMGHGSSPVTIEKVSTGVYRATKVFFSMKADWEIRFQNAGDQAVYAITI